MRLRLHVMMVILVCSSLLFTACSAGATEQTGTETLSPTPDLCGPDTIDGEIDKINHLMREFDDASLLAANTARDQLRPAISELQRIRRDAEDLQVPPCLGNLKTIQLAHMNLVISTLTAFMGGADQASVNEGIGRARQLHDQYTLEIARLLGITVVAVTSSAPSETPAANVPATPAGTFITNPGPTAVNLRAAPALEALNLGLLEVGLSALVLGRSSDNQWLLIEIPGQPGQSAWVFTSLVVLAGTLDAVPVVTPAP